MPTGPSHYVIRRENGPSSRWYEPCRCLIGSDYNPDGYTIREMEFEHWDREEGRKRTAPNCPVCSGDAACALCEDDD